MASPASAAPRRSRSISPSITGEVTGSAYIRDAGQRQAKHLRIGQTERPIVIAPGGTETDGVDLITDRSLRTAEN